MKDGPPRRSTINTLASPWSAKLQTPGESGAHAAATLAIAAKRSARLTLRSADSHGIAYQPHHRLQPGLIAGQAASRGQTVYVCPKRLQCELAHIPLGGI